MRFRTSVFSFLTALCLLVQLSAVVLAQHDGSCSINPNPATLNQSYTISATNLPTVDPVWLIANSPTGDSTVSPVAVNPDGTASVTTSSAVAGTWTYDFSGLQTNNKYGTVASCAMSMS
jgi:hypothetical protein